MMNAANSISEKNKPSVTDCYEKQTGSFSFRSVKGRDLNFSYYPKNTGDYDTKCITVNITPIQRRVVFSFYTDEYYPCGWDNTPESSCYKALYPRDEEHTSKLHKRIKPSDEHYHVDVSSATDPDLFIKTALKNIKIREEHTRFLYDSAQYLFTNPFEPGIQFNDGSFSENGGANSFEDETSNADSIEGPFIMFDEVYHLPFVDEWKHGVIYGPPRKHGVTGSMGSGLAS